MVERCLAVVLLLSWELALVSCPAPAQALFGAPSSIVVGLTMIVLLLAAAEREAAGRNAAAPDPLDQVPFTIPFH